MPKVGPAWCACGSPAPPAASASERLAPGLARPPFSLCSKMAAVLPLALGERDPKGARATYSAG